MRVTTAAVLTGGITAVGYWAQNKQLPKKFFVGIAIMALMLALMDEANTQFAQQFGILLVIAAAMYYMIPISKALGYSK